MERLLTATRQRLSEALSLDDRECESMMLMVRSQLDLSLSRLLDSDAFS